MLDFAIRRRFQYLYLAPSERAIATFYAGLPVRLRAVAVFRSLRDSVDEQDLRIGHSFFIIEGGEGDNDARWAERLVDRILYEVRPLFREYVDEGWVLKPAILDTGAGTIDLVNDSDPALRASLTAWLQAPVVVP